VSYLLDTHTLIWWLSNDERLSTQAKFLLDDDTSRCVVSAVTAYELGIKVQNGKLELARGILENFQAILDSNEFQRLSISIEHSLLAARLPTDHRDPFDRLLAAQAITERFDLLTVDTRIADMGARVIW
jgi:PIN domain nuclease of toxin-antitoxin system